MLSVLIAVAAAAPSGYGYAHGLSHAYSSHIIQPHVPVVVPEYHVSNHVSHVPTAVSHQSRVDYHSKPVYSPILAEKSIIVPQPGK